MTIQVYSSIFSYSTTAQQENSSSNELIPAIRVVKVDSSKNIQYLKKTVCSWYKLAKLRLEAFGIIDWGNKEKVALADTSVRVIYEIRKQLKKNLGNTSIYVAYDEKNKIQGIALATIGSEKAELDCLATHPKNIDLFEKENHRKGVGLSILTKVVSDVYTTSKNPLGLYAEPTAVNFYTKFGFTLLKDVPKKLTMSFLSLKHENMEKLAHTAIDLGV